MISNKIIFLLLLILIHSFYFNILQATLINEECLDSVTGKSYGHGEIWNSTEMCEIFKCEVMELEQPGRELSVSVGVKNICASIEKNDSCFYVEKQDGVFPNCCPMLVCIRESDVEIHFSQRDEKEEENESSADVADDNVVKRMSKNRIEWVPKRKTLHKTETRNRLDENKKIYKNTDNRRTYSTKTTIEPSLTNGEANNDSLEIDYP